MQLQRLQQQQRCGSSHRQQQQQHRRPPRRCAGSVAAAAAAPGRVQQSQQQQQQPPASGGALPAVAAAAAAAALVLQACAPLHVQASVTELLQQQAPHEPTGRVAQPVLGELAAAAAAAAPEVGGEDMTLQEIEDDIMGDVALPPELRDFMELLQKGPVKSAKKLADARRAVGFERSLDGRVLLLSEDGEPFQVKSDMGVAGALLLRDAGGYLYYIPPSDNDSLVQIDLSDDAVVAQLFANHAWEELVEPLEVMRSGDTSQQSQPRSKQQLQEPVGQLEQLRLSEREFRSVISLLSGSQELPEEPLEDLDAQERS